ncbi:MULTISPECIES: low molecular weight protein-tyrosine-phosphatase [Robiginitalea]|uniref:protein-tyrosine-phosphatase n=1 Tax=Robiginitalea biformata (strain ATCC BAA-864 / DSM 15991 / KCTC 12146 / HTCC2501) TaxID=313596 RepID=A4CLW8_ROBBH|nr:MULTISPECIES: low molecular weight protein-tyrosine-phosphatase [Robiginitalea]EAR15867.1 protein tyrosine phosphatase [Robiginitalea biformata HTCC2501]MDC6354290.1 low molecular weight phosphotyrosine protein phosphatase [Robiginitalea sp. PM2]MDC6374557.1 low molecular weight phosphotyrosine protein phosphatase [Robiginitalea sp. SP8]
MATRILMVCLGNICRSPLAEGIFASKLAGEDYVVDSAGTAGYHVGNPPDPRSIEVAAQYGIDISRQRCRRFSVSDFDNFDYIFAMDLENQANILSLARNERDRAKVSLLLEAGGKGRREVPDPYYGGADGFEQVYRMIDTACDYILAEYIGKPDGKKS